MNEVPLDLTPDEADEMLPVGSVLPFLPGFVPDNWEEFNGQKLYRGEHPDLYLRIKRATEIWEQMGGKVGAHFLILPDPTLDETNRLVWGINFKKAVPMVLAIKVRRRVRD